MAVLDTLRLDVPAGVAELALLHTMKPGMVRPGTVLEGLGVPLDWTCTAVAAMRWTFEGRFFGQRLMTLTIQQGDTVLTLSSEEVVL